MLKRLIGANLRNSNLGKETIRFFRSQRLGANTGISAANYSTAMPRRDDLVLIKKEVTSLIQPVANTRPDFEDQIKELESLISTKMELGKGDEVISHLERKLDLEKQVLGKEHYQVGVTIMEIGKVLESMREHHTAMQYYQKAKHILSGYEGSSAADEIDELIAHLSPRLQGAS
ncbi:MAG: tetratricopeptide repeat protein [Proteobacteria bacterium]|nr:tetratricopeptide repeat protein [Pseudomonadota bacterium]